jgi:ferredoxin
MTDDQQRTWAPSGGFIRRRHARHASKERREAGGSPGKGKEKYNLCDLCASACPVKFFVENIEANLTGEPLNL